MRWKVSRSGLGTNRPNQRTNRAESGTSNSAAAAVSARGVSCLSSEYNLMAAFTYTPHNSMCDA
jgi:hypothetical protein